MYPGRGIMLKLIAVTLFVAMAALIKATADAVPPGEAVFFRSFFALPVILAWIAPRGDLTATLSTSDPRGHFLRGLLGAMAMGLMFTGLGLLPLHEATALRYTTPLMVVIFAALVLGEPVRLFRISAVALGLVGVLVVLSPRLSVLSGDMAMGMGETVGVVVMLGGATCAAMAHVFLRQLAQQEQTAAIVFWFSVTASGLALLTLPFGWVLPDLSTALMLILAGILGGIGQIFLTAAYRCADAGVIAPYDYASMLLALAIGYLAFGEVPTATMLAGAALVIAAGVIIIWRERQLGLKRGRARPRITPEG